jgi:hypothetical protein
MPVSAAAISDSIDGSVAADDTLRERRGAARVQIADGVTVVDKVLRLGRVAGVQFVESRPPAIRQRLLVLPVGAVGDHDIGDGRHLLHRCHRRCHQLRLDDDPARLRVIEDVGDLVRAPAEVHRHADDAQLRAREVGDEELRAVAGREGKRVAAPVAEPGQAVRHPVDPLVQLRVRPASVAVDDCELVRQPRSGAGERVADVDARDQVARQLEVHGGSLPPPEPEGKCRRIGEEASRGHGRRPTVEVLGKADERRRR